MQSVMEVNGRFRSNGQNEREVVEALNELFQYCVEGGISDIHLQLNDLRVGKIKIRDGGKLVDYLTDISPSDSELILSKIASKALLNEKERSVALDGRLHMYFCDRAIDGRVSIIPTNAGRKIVIRILDSNNSKLNIDDFEVGAIVKDTLKSVISNPEGIMVVSGPTGSGKTTTLYSSLNYRNSPDVQILTIEHPVEYSIPEFDQMNVTGQLTFAKALRAALRQDPDIIMVGEIRDEESAQAAFMAGETGHMVFTTVHSLDTFDTISRLIGLGLSRQQIAGVLSGVLAQRLVKRIPDGAQIQWTAPNEVERKWLNKFGFKSDSLLLPRINIEDMKGRIPMMELVEINSELRHLIADEGVPLSSIVKVAATQPQFETLTQAGLRLVLAGKTTLSEVMFATRDSVSPPAFKRFEQIMVENGWLSMDHLDLAFQDQISQKNMGLLTPLEEILRLQGNCQATHIDMAIAISDGREIVTPMVRDPVTNASNDSGLEAIAIAI